MPFAPQLTPAQRRACGPPQAAPPPIAPRRDAARSPEPTARRPMRCRRSARVSRVLGRRAPGAAPEGRPRQPARASAALRLLSIAIMPLVTAAAAVDSAAPTSDAQISRGRRTLGAAAAAQVPTTGRRRRGGTCTYCARRRQRAAESPGRVLCAPGRPAAGCPWALRRAGRRRPIAHQRRGVVPGSLPFQGGRCGLRPRRAGSCGGWAAYPRLSTHQVPRSRLAHAY